MTLPNLLLIPPPPPLPSWWEDGGGLQVSSSVALIINPSTPRYLVVHITASKGWDDWGGSRKYLRKNKVSARRKKIAKRNGKVREKFLQRNVMMRNGAARRWAYLGGGFVGVGEGWGEGCWGVKVGERSTLMNATPYPFFPARKNGSNRNCESEVALSKNMWISG